MRSIVTLLLKLIVLLTVSGFIGVYIYNLNNPGRDHRATKSQFINFGNSHGNFLKYELFGLKGINAFVSGNSPYYFNSLYKHYKKDLEEGAVVIIPLSYHSFGIDSGKPENAPFNNQFYHYLEPGLIRHYSLEKHIDILNEAVNKNTMDFLVGEGFENKPLKDTIRFSLFSYAKLAAYNYKKIEIDRSEKAIFFGNKHKELFKDVHVKPNISFISELVNDAIKSGFKVVLVTPPYTKQYREMFPSEWLNTNFYKNIDEITNKFQVPYLDFSQSEDFNYSGLFNDPHHMNVYGKTIFSKVFLDSLHKYNYIDQNNLPTEIPSFSNHSIENDLVLLKVEKIKLNNEELAYVFFFNQSPKKFYKGNVDFVLHHGNREIKRKINNNNTFIVLRTKSDDLEIDFSFQK